MVAIASGRKPCCQCGKDLSNSPRKKDAQSRYWCLSCDQIERRMDSRGFSARLPRTDSLAGEDAAKRARLVKMLSLIGGMTALALVFHFFIYR